MTFWQTQQVKEAEFSRVGLYLKDKIDVLSWRLVVASKIQLQEQIQWQIFIRVRHEINRRAWGTINDL
jgi:hypothetical protein